MSKIEWTDETWNPVTGCTKISEGCQNCYAERMATTRLAGRCGYPKDKPFSITYHPDRLTKPGEWKKPKKIFVCSMGDLFHDDVDFEYILKIFTAINRYNHHTFQVLTKRPERMLQFFRDYGLIPDPVTGFTGSGETIPENVWIGVTAENQYQAVKRIPILFQIPAAVRFVSVEPMLSTVNLEHLWHTCPHCGSWEIYEPRNQQMSCDDCGVTIYKPAIGIDWVICGGETGPGARPINHEWVSSLHQQCANTETPFFFKKWGAWWPNKAGGNSGSHIDGKLYQEFPEE